MIQKSRKCLYFRTKDINRNKETNKFWFFDFVAFRRKRDIRCIKTVKDHLINKSNKL